MFAGGDRQIDGVLLVCIVEPGLVVGAEVFWDLWVGDIRLH